jgi:hypothetical protein
VYGGLARKLLWLNVMQPFKTIPIGIPPARSLASLGKAFPSMQTISHFADQSASANAFEGVSPGIAIAPSDCGNKLAAFQQSPGSARTVTEVIKGVGHTRDLE